MAEIINLRQVRKAARRAQAATVADANRLAFGRSKVARMQDQDAATRATRHLDSHRRETSQIGPAPCRETGDA